MGQITRARAIAVLRKANPQARADDLAIYADSFLDYVEASANIAKNGTICAHPRTGAPIENPYFKVKLAALAVLKKLKRLRNVGSLWELVPRDEASARRRDE